MVQTGPARLGQADLEVGLVFSLCANKANFAALFIFHFKVATTIGSGIIDQGIVDHYVIFGALVGAITWNIITWYYGIPSSSSHALIGGLVGAAVAKAGTWALIPAGLWKTVVFILLSPMLGIPPITSGAITASTLIVSLLGAIVLLAIVNLVRRGAVR